jgi:hypothetical protein
VIIHRIDDAKRAIDRYFDERNYQFQKLPRRAGRKIWGKEREPATFSDSRNCKDPATGELRAERTVGAILWNE